MDKPTTDHQADDQHHRLAPGQALANFLPYKLFRISNRLTLTLRENLRPVKITLPRWRVLSVLSARDGRSIGELAEFTVIGQSTLSRVIDQMERDKLVERRPSKKDNRIVQVFLKPAGKETFEKILPSAMLHYKRAIEGFSEEEQKTLDQFLRRIWDNIS